MGDVSPESRSGCGLFNAVFGRKSFWSKRSTSTGSMSSQNAKNNSRDSTKRRRSTDEILFSSNCPESEMPAPKPLSCSRNPSSQKQPRQQPQRPVNVRKPPPDAVTVAATTQNHNQGRKVPTGALGISGELDALINDYQRNKGGTKFVRASSSNVMLFGNLGNLRGGVGSTAVVDDLPIPPREENPAMITGRHSNGVNGDYHKDGCLEKQHPSGSLCRALSTRMDPEQLKMMGNEDYKNGNFAEALALYDAAIAIDPTKASYRSNKSAALTALGMLLEAVFECREAVRIEPNYHRAHHRLANLYIRLGEADTAIYHYKHSGPEADHIDVSKAKALQGILNKCIEARKMRDWMTLIKETKMATSSGADSAPQIYALQAEALIKLHRHQAAEEALANGPNFSADACVKFFGPIAYANLLVVRAQVDMANGRFEDAMAVAQKATAIDSSNREAINTLKKAKRTGEARSKGNQLFKAGKFQEACLSYEDGLEEDPYNSVLLFNRATCRTKLGQHEKAAEDCTAALHVRPNYVKAKLRRADCYSKMGDWEASIKDYESLQNECPDDEEVRKALEEARIQFNRQRGEES